MFRLLAVIAFVPTIAQADRFELYAPITDVVLHPEGAWVQRLLEIEVPQGDHVLVLPAASDAVEGSELIELGGATITARRYEEVEARKPAALESAATASARDVVKVAEDALQALIDQKAALLLPKSEGDARLRFLEQIGDNDGLLQLDPAALQAMTAMIGAEVRSATELTQSAETAARLLDDQIRDAEAVVNRAKAELAGQVRDGAFYRQLVLEITADTDATVQISHRSFVYNAGWTPVYEFHLEGPDSNSVGVIRRILVSQQGEEAWNDVFLTLSTAAPLSQSAPSELRPRLLRIVEPQPQVSASRKVMEGDVMMEPVVVVEEAASGYSSSYDGLNVTYQMPGKVTVPTSHSHTSLPMPDLTFNAVPYAVAVPRHDEEAYLVADITNSGSEPLPGDGARALTFVAGALVGETSLGSIAPGEEVSLPFGPIEGLLIDATVLDDNAGDRGILRGSLFQTQSRRFDLENLTPRDWGIRVLGQVPYSGQEDLEITWEANPAPDEVNTDDKRGILRWDVSLAPGEKTSISLDQRIKWPEGYELR